MARGRVEGVGGGGGERVGGTFGLRWVFAAVLFVGGPGKYLFTPLGLAVVFAMLASYALSRTLTPIMIGLLTKGEHHGGAAAAGLRGWFSSLHHGFDRGFERMRAGYVDLLTALLTRRFFIPVAAVLVLALGGTLFMFVGRDFFPLIDRGQIQLHVRAPAGTRIEATEAVCPAGDD